MIFDLNIISLHYSRLPKSNRVKANFTLDVLPYNRCWALFVADFAYLSSSLTAGNSSGSSSIVLIITNNRVYCSSKTIRIFFTRWICELF